MKLTTFLVACVVIALTNRTDVAVAETSQHTHGCYDVSKGEPASLEGILTHVIFPGPPNFTSVQNGDTPEPGYILTLEHPICITGDQGFSNPANHFSQVQLIPEDNLERSMPLLVNDKVHVTLTQQMAAETGHHHRPLVAWVTEIHSLAGANDTDTFVADDGAAGTVVRSFYSALAAGDGDTASRYIVPEKRGKPAFAADRLTDFYGHLVEPLRLIGMDRSNGSDYVVRYTFRSNAGRCNGQAVVSTVKRDGSNFISGIRSLSGC